MKLPKCIYIIIILFIAFVSCAFGQSKSEGYNISVKEYCDSITKLHKRVYSGSVDEIKINPILYKLISPSIYYRSPLLEQLKINDSSTRVTSLTENVSNNLLINLYANNANYLQMHEGVLNEEKLVIKDKTKTPNADKVIQDVLKPKTEETDVSDFVEDIQIEVTRPNFWKTSCTFSSQFTQNYFSDNWYRGGNNNATMLTSLTVKANYNDQKKISWENTAEMRLGFITTTDDSCHNFLTNNDRIRLWSKLGVKASKTWSYTTTLEAITQFMPSHRSNDRRTYADFLAPLDVILSIGMDYKPTFKNGNSLSIVLSPLSYKLRYIGSKDETIHNATNMKDKNTKEDFGSKMELQSNVNIIKNLTWTCRFVAFTSYEYVESELENKLRFKLTKYISSEFNTLWRFDDNRPKQYKDDKIGYFQFREYLTFGLTYDF